MKYSSNLKKTRIPSAARDSRKNLPRFDPQLPRVMWEEFRRDYEDSLIFTPVFSDLRHQMLTKNQGCVSLEVSQVHRIRFDDFFPSKKNTNGGGSWLHLAVVQGDLPLAQECVRMGTPIEYMDWRGYSALYSACTMLNHLLVPDGPAGAEDLPPVHESSEDLIPAFASQLVQICLLLLEQHADPDEVHDGLSLLGLACLSEQWDLVQALLLHGTNTSLLPFTPSSNFPARCLKTPYAKRIFEDLVSTFLDKPRPHRLCPCASGSALEDCHFKAQSCSAEGICPCGAGKILANCCMKREEMYWVEKWNSRELRLEPLCIPRITRNPEMQKNAEPYASDPGNLPESFSNYVNAVLRGLAEHNQIDPAYAAAAFKVPFHPLHPKGARTMSKIQLGEVTRAWNVVVDEYIASGVDPRPIEVIENAAKVGIAGGPLHRRCEDTSCPNIEYRRGVKLSVCSGCNTAVYCSRTCQKNAWKAHRSACRTGSVGFQMLPSQEAYVEQLNFGIQEIRSAVLSSTSQSDHETVRDMFENVLYI